MTEHPEPQDVGDGEDDTSASSLDALVATRREKVAELRGRGEEPYAIRFSPTTSLAEIRQRFADLDPGEETGEEAVVAGRVVGKRDIGKLVFLVLREDGVDLQLFCQQRVLGDAGMEAVADIDLGDWVGARGGIMTTNKGELSVSPSEITLLGKALRPLPDKWHGLRDVELRYRQRELDLIVNEETRQTFRIRSVVVAALRRVLEERDFVEVETPMLHPIPGGATARPFITHHNALDVDLYLRVAPELYLKRLIVGGFPRVYELNRSFRNEGMSPRHNPEYTMLEVYQAYADYRDMMELTEALVVAAAEAAVGTLELTYLDRPLDLTPPWPRRTMLELVHEAVGRDDFGYDTPLDDLRTLLDEQHLLYEEDWGPGKLIAELYESLVEHELWDPVFVTEHPVETSPLARRHREAEHVTERFEPVAVGRELGNAFSELTDPDDQRERFEAQAAARDAGDEEAMAVDEAYVAALELGMPPTGGLGIGVDRLVMILADVPSIRDVILFPTLRPERDPD